MKNEQQSSILHQELNEFKDVLSSKIKECNQVFLIAHKNPDYDAIASLGAMSLVCKRHKKASYIIIDDVNDLPEKEKVMIEKIKEKFIVISLKDYEDNKTNNDLLIMVDVNKDFRTSLEGKYKLFKSIIIVDHHDVDSHTVKTNYKFITQNASSCSEMMYFLLSQYKIKSSDPCYYTYLLTGIHLDTKRFTKGVFPSTHEAANGLCDRGANQIEVDDFFALDYESDRRVHALIDKMNPENTRIMLSVCSDVCLENEVAQAADYALNYGCDATIVAAMLKSGEFKVCARSKGRVDVSNIMHALSKTGGGNAFSAACIYNHFVDDNASDLEKSEELRKEIVKILTYRK